jgi:hypothetical protein
MLRAAPGVRTVAIFDELLRRHPELGASVRQTLERRVRSWRALYGEESRRWSSARRMSRAVSGCRTSPA